MTSLAHRARPDFLPEIGEMGKRIRSFNWSETPVGSIESWPEPLKTAVRICISSRHPMVLWWGRRDLTQFYNDAYISFLGEGKHPHYLGWSARDCWSEIWHIVEPMVESVFETGEATWSEEFLFVLNRNLPREEGYFTFSYSPIWDDFANVGGIFCACYETTGRVIGERRLRTLRDLGRTMMRAKTVEEASELMAHTLADNRADVPFALIYLADDKAAQAHLAASMGIPEGSAAAPGSISLTDSAVWPLRQVLQTGTAELVSGLEERFGQLSGGPWPESPHSALVLPVAGAGQARPIGSLICGLSPRRIVDTDYRSFFDLIAGHLATAIANARATEVERRRAEALAELDRAKTRFFSNVSHEFRTPLTLMLGPLESVLSNSNAVSPQAHEQLATAHRNSLRLLKMVNSLLDFTRMEAGRVKASYQPVDLASFVADLASTFRSVMEAGGLQLRVDCPPLPQPVYVDREMWEKIVLNLLSNAFKFTLQGEVAVRLESNNGEAVLSISDTGLGIPEDERPHIFERFHRVEGAKGRTYEGTGIGLALVQELIKAHGGSVTVASAVGRGSTFTVRFPFGKNHLPPDRVIPAAAPPETRSHVEPYVGEALGWLAGEKGPPPDVPARVPEEGPAPGGHGSAAPGERPARVLLADDNADMREYVRRLLGGDMQVVAVSNGREALAAALKDPPDLLLSDVMMPVLDGFGLIRELRAHAETATIPVILLSARAGEESRVEGLTAGADDYLVKPFSSEELFTRVTTHIKMARARQEALAQLRRSEAELRRANDDLTQFAYSATHDLKEPLRNISIYSQLLLRRLGDAGDGEIQEYLNDLLRETERMTMLLADLLAYTQVTTEPGVTSWSDAGQALAKALEDLKLAIAESQAEVVADELPALPVADVHLHQLFQNLIGNAIKYRDPARAPRVRVSASRQRSDWEFAVEDNGIGIAPEYHTRIFGLFKRLHSSDRYSGTGIGLALAKRIVELYGGRIWVESKQGSGSVFLFNLPAGDSKS